MDKDDIDITNINRQIHATTLTVGCSKVEEMKKRILAINPNCEVTAIQDFYTEETYKIHLMKHCLRNDIKFISVMGTANKMDPTRFQIADIRKTTVCPLAKVIRIKLKKDNIKGKVPVVYSMESPTIANKEYLEKIGNQKSDIRKSKIPPASNAFCPSTAGLIAANYVYTNLLKNIKILTIEKSN